MSVRTTPLGFLPGDIDLHSHCIFLYSKKDKAFVESVTAFLAAGVNAGEMCVCAVNGSVREEIREHMARLGIPSSSESGQLLILDAADVYLRGSSLDTEGAVRFWRDKFEVAGSKWNGLRAFGDAGPVRWSRAARLKILEYEALLNIDYSTNIGLCGYQSSVASRSFLLQAKSVHPFVANVRSIRRNQAFLTAPKFFAGFYRFRRSSRVYPGALSQIQATQEDFEEIAARTPLTILEIDDVKAAIGAAFAALIEHCSYGDSAGLSHVHVVFVSDVDGFTILLRCHRRPASYPEVPGLDQLRQRIVHLTPCPMDELHVESRNLDTVVTMVRRYEYLPPVCDMLL